MKIVSLVNQKGGVGKTSSAISIAAELGRKGKTVLLIDLDPQGNTTTNSKIKKSDLKITIKDLFLNDDITAKECIIETEKEYDLIGGNLEVADTEINLFNKFSRETILRDKLSKLNYDYIIIDCSPSLSLMNLNALITSHLALIPVEAHIFAVEGIESLLNAINTAKKLNENLEKKFFITKFDQRINDFKEIESHLREVLNGEILNTKIRVDNTIRKAQNKFMTVFEYDTKSKAVEDYTELVKEVLNG